MRARAPALLRRPSIHSNSVLFKAVHHQPAYARIFVRLLVQARQCVLFLRVLVLVGRWCAGDVCVCAVPDAAAAAAQYPGSFTLSYTIEYIIKVGSTNKRETSDYLSLSLIVPRARPSWAFCLSLRRPA